MQTFIQDIRTIVGAPPAGLEVVEYVTACLLLVILSMSAVGLISSIFKWIGDK